MLCTQRPPWISDPDISDNSPVFPSILIINSLEETDTLLTGEGESVGEEQTTRRRESLDLHI
jgi:hypothetical protein